MGSHPLLLFKMKPPTRLALLLLLGVLTVEAQPRQARQDGEETTTSTQASTTAKEMMDEGADAEEANEVVDPMDQCGKCRKAAYTYKKKFFCQKCVKEGHLKEEETVVNCSKCRKPRYRARNGDFCSEECPDISAGGLVDNSNMVDKAEVEPTVVTSSVETDEAKELGVLGSIFKFLVEANTWGEVPASIPSAAEVEVEEEEEDNDLKEDVEVEMER